VPARGRIYQKRRSTTPLFRSTTNHPIVAEKSKQHLLPIVYQRSFADDTRPVGLPEHTPFEPRVWLIPRTFRALSRPKAPKNAFRATRYYNLAADDPRQPLVEHKLGESETRFGALLPALTSRQELALSGYLDLVTFIGGPSTMARRPISGPGI